MGIMTESGEVRIEVFKHGEDVVDVLLVIGASGPVRGFGMHVGTLQEDRFAVEQDTRSVYADVTETDLVREFVLTGGDFNLVELWRIRRPEIELVGLHLEGCAALSVCFEGATDTGVGDAESDRGSGGGTFYVDVTCEGVGIGGGEAAFALEVDVIVVDELCRKCNQRDIAGETTVVAP